MSSNNSGLPPLREEYDMRVIAAILDGEVARVENDEGLKA